MLGQFYGKFVQIIGLEAPVSHLRVESRVLPSSEMQSLMTKPAVGNRGTQGFLLGAYGQIVEQQSALDGVYFQIIRLGLHYTGSTVWFVLHGFGIFGAVIAFCSQLMASIG